MGNQTLSFDDWFEQVCDLLADEGINFSDRDAALEDYEQGKSIFDVVDEIKEEQ